MRVTGLKTRVLVKELDGTAWNPQTVWKRQCAVLVFLETDSGLTGVGEAWAIGGPPDPVVALIEGCADYVVGESPFAASRIWERIRRTDVVGGKGAILFHAQSAIDIALWDIIGKATGQPLYRLLGGHADRVPAYASGGLYGRGKTTADLAAEVAGYVAKGFAGVKIKVGGASPDEDERRVAAVREAIGPDKLLLVDAVWSLTPAEAIRLARRIDRYDVLMFEAPVVAADVEGCARVNAEGPIPVSGHDHGAGLDDYRRLIAGGAVSYVLISPIACGGIGEAVRIAALAKAWRLPCTFHAATTAVAALAALHVAAAIANGHSVECHQIHRALFDRLPAGALEPRDGHLSPPDRPGLGIVLTDADLA